MQGINSNRTNKTWKASDLESYAQVQVNPENILKKIFYNFNIFLTRFTKIVR